MSYASNGHLYVQLLDSRATIPSRGSEFAAGLDLYAYLDQEVPWGSFAIVPTGIAVALPRNHYGRVAPRSGLSARSGLDVLGGVIDEDYRGEVKVILSNYADYGPYKIKAGDRIAQLIVTPYASVGVVQTTTLVETARGEAGLGSTGL